MNKMLFDFNQSPELLTPFIIHDGVNKINPLLTSSDAFRLDENDIHFSSLPSEKNEYELTPKDNTNNNSDNNQQEDDLFSTFEFPVLSELDKTEFHIDGLELDKYSCQLACPSPAMDFHNSVMSDDSIFFATEDSESPWVGEACTVESGNTEDMMVPPSPSLSSASCSSVAAEKRSTKKRSFSTNERRLRKKDQNKTAAEKYRLKKRSEKNELITRHSNLKAQNQELKFEFENLTFRLEQVKHLFVDILQIPIPPTK